MSKKSRSGVAGQAAVGLSFALTMAPAFSQDASTPSAPSSTAPTAPQTANADSRPISANPYYLGASQGFTHDTNVFRIPDGPSDTYSTTSLQGGFDQRIGRQRVFGSGNVAANRYFNQSDLNNVSYGLAGGLDWETIERLSGNVNVALNRNLAAPVTTSSLPTAQRNIVDTESVDTRARLGGASLLTLEAALGYGRTHYSAPQSVVSNSTQNSGGLTLFYRPGGHLRLGVGGRLTRTRTPQAFFNSATGEFESNTVDGRNLDLLADYDLSGLLSFNGRLSYTRQTNSAISNINFSGLTGSVGLVYHLTGKTDINLQAARDAGYDSSFFNTFAAVQSGTSVVVTPIAALFENNRITDTVGLGASYAATGKIGVNAGVRYVRARISTAAIAGTASQAAPDTTDLLRSAYIGANYAILRNVSAACNLSHESRRVSGGIAFAYTDTAIGCSAQVYWR
jgi:hypothetical protein